MKRMCAALLAVLAAMVMTGCTPTPQAPVERQWTELTYVTNLEDAEQLITLQTPLLEQKGIRLTRIELTGEDPEAELERLMAGEDRPDLYLVKDVQLTQVLLWQQQGALRTVPAGKLRARETLWDKAGPWAGVLSDGSAWSAIPVEAWNPGAGGSEMMLYCRTDWARNLGVEDLSSMDWAGFIRLMQGYAHGDPDNNGEADTWGLTYAGDPLGGLEDIFYGSFGVGEWVWEEDRLVPGWSSEAAKTATEWLVQLRREGVLDPEGMNRSPEEALELFCRGYAGMILWDDPARLESLWRDVQATREKARPINENVTVLALPTNPYGEKAMMGSRSGAPLALIGADVDDESLEKLLSVMEDVGRLAWKLPETLAEDASFTQRCEYRQRIYYRPYQNNVPCITQRLCSSELNGVSAVQLETARERLAQIIVSPESFAAQWALWQQDNGQQAGAYTTAVNEGLKGR